MNDAEINKARLARLLSLARMDLKNYLVTGGASCTYLRIEGLHWNRTPVTPLFREWVEASMRQRHSFQIGNTLYHSHLFAHPRWFAFVEKWRRNGIDLNNLTLTND